LPLSADIGNASSSARTQASDISAPSAENADNDIVVSLVMPAFRPPSCSTSAATRRIEALA
jgi:hypothetical protein